MPQLKLLPAPPEVWELILFNMGKKRNIIIGTEIEQEKTVVTPKPSDSSVSTNISNLPNHPNLPNKKGKKPAKTHGKLYIKAKALVNPTTHYTIEEAVALVKQITFSKKNNTVEAHINLGLDLTKQDHKIRTMVSYPHGTGKTIKVLTINEGEVAKIEEIVSGKLAFPRDFDLVVVHPSVMKEMAKVAKILGPKGVMPNPKNGTISANPQKTAVDLQKGSTEIKVEKLAPVVHTIIGKTNFEDKQLVENFNALIAKIKEIRPAKVKGAYIKSAYLTSSMSPSVKVTI